MKDWMPNIYENAVPVKVFFQESKDDQVISTLTFLERQ